MIIDKNIQRIIINYLNENITPEESNVLISWLEEDEINISVLDAVNRRWVEQHPDNEELDFQEDTAWDEFKDRYLGSSPAKSERRSLSPVFYYSAAAVALVLIIFSFFFSRQPQSSEPFLVEVPPGSRISVTLPDSSIVWVNSGSKLKYSGDFGKKDRCIELEGEAIFEVSKDNKKPFVVSSADMNISVLGTVFNVRAYKERNIEISLQKGSVAISSDRFDLDNYKLTPNEIIILDRTSGEYVKKKTDVKKYMVWKEGGFHFDDLPLGEIIEELERTYDIIIKVKRESLKTERYYGFFERYENINDILDIMASGNRFQYTIRNNVVEIY